MGMIFQPPTLTANHRPPLLNVPDQDGLSLIESQSFLDASDLGDTMAVLKNSSVRVFVVWASTFDIINVLAAADEAGP